MSNFNGVLNTPIGTVEVRASNHGVSSVMFVDHPVSTMPNEVVEAAISQLQEYFLCTRRVFELPLDTTGTPFQQQVWQTLCRVPFGVTRSYQWVAQQLNNPNAVRAVGAANGKNPLSIIVPCHRIIGKSGTLTGYAGGLSRKAWLLAHEQANTTVLNSNDIQT